MKEKVEAKILMCAPTHMPPEVPYSINPWMKPGEKINTKKAMRQWENLHNTYEQIGAKVTVIEQQKGLPDMVFAADQGIVQENHVLLSRFRHPERQPENLYYAQWFRKNEYVVRNLPKDQFFEGHGETQFWNNTVFVGHGVRSDESTIPYLRNFFSNHEIIPLKITNPRFYHVDVGLFPLNEETVFYSPDAFCEESKKVLQEKVPNLIPLSQKETHAFAANSVTLGEYVVFQQPSFTDSLTRSGTKSFEKKVKQLNKEPVGVDVSEFKKLGGGIHCLTNILRYKKI